MVSIKAGVEHLREKFTSLSNSSEDEFDLGEHDDIEVVEDNLPDIIRSSGDILVDVHKRTKTNELQIHLDEQDTKLIQLKQSASYDSLDNRRPMTGGATENRPFNRRIALPSAKESAAFDSGISDNDDESVYDDIGDQEEISRDGVKKSSFNVIAIEEKRRLARSSSSGI